MTTPANIQSILEQAGALKRGHFVLSSGLHSDRYCQCAALFERPDLAEAVADSMAVRLPESLEVRCVLAPALGGVLWGYELARSLSRRTGRPVRSLFAERDPSGAFSLRRGFTIDPGEAVLLAEDVVTTGDSVSELIPLVERLGARVVGIAAIADRSRGAFRPSVPFHSLIELNFDTWPADRLPLHLRDAPIDKPGSRPSPPHHSSTAMRQ